MAVRSNRHTTGPAGIPLPDPVGLLGQASARPHDAETRRSGQAARGRALAPQARGQAAEPPLVYIRNLLPALSSKALPGGLREVVDSETGEILTARQGHDCSLQIVKSPAEARARRFYRLAAARELLGTGHRVNACLRVPRKGADAVEVWRKRGADANVAGHFKGVVVCGSGWLCAVCGSKISERRREELQRAVTGWQAEGGSVCLVTYTFSHGRFDVLSETLDKLARARRRLKSGREYEAIRADFGIEGTVLAHEITHGERHGWHPHYHELVFVKGGELDMGALRRRLYAKWVRACELSGLGTPSWEHGLDVRGGEAAAEYVSKGGMWSLEHEMTKGHLKEGRGGSRSPGQLLDCAVDLAADEAHRGQARRLWLGYAAAMKGKSQLQWSRGFKARFGLAEVTDEEIANSQADAEAALIARLSLDDWRVVVRHELQGAVLERAVGGAQAIEALLAVFRNKGEEAHLTKGRGDVAGGVLRQSG